MRAATRARVRAHHSVERALLAAALWSLATAEPVGAQQDLAGSYRLEANELRAEVSQWGQDCGPRPQSAKDPARPTVEVQAKGAQLALAFPDRTVRTDACWSPNLNVRVANATATATRWRVECRTPEGDAKRERGAYSVVVGADGALELLEESEYDWQLKESHCVAKVRISQRLARSDGQAPAMPPAAAEEPPPKCTPGALERLRLRPSSAQIAPGERACFTVRGFDAAGCAVKPDESELRWSLTKPEAASGTFTKNCFKAADRAAEAEGQFRLAVSSGDARDESVINVVPADLSDITARRGTRPEELESDDEEGDGIISDLGIEAAVKRSAASLPLAIAALLLASVAGLTWFVFSRLAARRAQELARTRRNSQRRRSSAPAARMDSARPAVPSAATPHSSSPSGAGEQLICPTCRRGYPGGTERCPRDGSTPIPYAEFVRQAQAAEARAHTCPACGAQLIAGARFCGVCGARIGA